MQVPEGRSHFWNNLDPASWDEKPTHTHIGINIKHNFNQTNCTTLPIFRVSISNLPFLPAVRGKREFHKIFYIQHSKHPAVRC
ncbi:MAG: hypothetical protein JGK26_20815 [Microcoleus sp. PH2017_27_LUM_O_A]|nr:hypothetical protein [Microcoleus sp. PH2017_11_PCY_U_A]MCC3561528.1 hypothetical protein [Microcoleus sp. PH2017_27_LUM_O_A]